MGYLERSGIFQNPVQSSDTERFMQGNGDGMIFAPYHRVKMVVAPALMYDAIPIRESRRASSFLSVFRGSFIPQSVLLLPNET
jgi:hypothetical protein